jgi:hypothetical protein
MVKKEVIFSHKKNCSMNLLYITVKEFVCIKLLVINEDTADKKIINCTNAAKFKKKHSKVYFQN